MNLVLCNLFIGSTYQVSEIGYLGNGLVGDELEGHAREDESK